MSEFRLNAVAYMFCISAVQEILGLTTMSESQRKVYAYQPPADVEVLAFNHFTLYRANHT